MKYLLCNPNLTHGDIQNISCVTLTPISNSKFEIRYTRLNIWVTQKVFNMSQYYPYVSITLMLTLCFEEVGPYYIHGVGGYQEEDQRRVFS